MSVRLNKLTTDRLMKKLQKLPNHLIKKSGKFFKEVTPIDTGNARKKTRTVSNTIKAEYPYAGRLDEGWSKQAPKGMSQPTLDEMDEIIEDFVRSL